MILMFISAILIVFCGQLFALNFSIMGLNRVVINTPIELIYKTVNFSGGDPTFKKETFQEEIIRYYDEYLPRYSESHEIEFYYYNVIDGSLCIEEECNSVEITVNCKLKLNYDYHRVMYYEIKES